MFGLPFAFLANPLARKLLLALAAFAIMAGAVAWLRMDAADDAIADRDRAEAAEILNAIERSKPKPSIGADECLERLRNGQPCI